MTIENTKIRVSLTPSNWIGIVAIVITLLGMLIPAYINHDRLLMQVVTNQEAMSKRLDKIEAKLERNDR
ncbi:MAG: hypothetical protein KGR21_09755 [Proteobacteria bacterium]|nr:hypothetical protein [Pseudomonadota bacterium]